MKKAKYAMIPILSENCVRAGKVHFQKDGEMCEGCGDCTLYHPSLFKVIRESAKNVGGVAEKYKMTVAETLESYFD